MTVRLLASLRWLQSAGGADGSGPSRCERSPATRWSWRLQQRRLLDGQGQSSAEGRQLRIDIEDTTDRLAMLPCLPQGGADRQRLLDALSSAATEVSMSGVIRCPNPIGLPRLA
jgi:hypothetical protein